MGIYISRIRGPSARSNVPPTNNSTGTGPGQTQVHPPHPQPIYVMHIHYDASTHISYVNSHNITSSSMIGVGNTITDIHSSFVIHDAHDQGEQERGIGTQHDGKSISSFFFSWLSTSVPPACIEY